MTDYVYLKVAGVWHRATQGDLVPNETPGGGHRPITADPRCAIDRKDVSNALFSEPPEGEPRHDVCWSPAP